MKQPLILLFITSVYLTVSCTTLKRYDSIQQPGTDNALAAIDLFGFRLSKAKPENGNKTLWDLSADAQTQYIKILNVRYPDNENFINALNLEYLKDDQSVKAEDYVNKDLRMIFSISKLHGFSGPVGSSGFDPSPADRIEYLKITLRIPGSPGLKFTGWNKFTTEYGSVNIADVSFSRSIEINGSGLFSSDRKVTAGEIAAEGKYIANRKEDQEILYRYLKLNGRINNNEIEMEEEGTREIDLTGNIAADISLEFERFPEVLTEISGIRDSTGHLNSAESLAVQHTDAIVPGMENIKDTIFAELKMDYVLRNVLRGQKTFPEWDDRVKYYTGSVSKMITLFTSADYVPDFYCIGINHGNHDREIIKISEPGNREYPLIFRTRPQAAAFFEWLTDNFSKPGNKGKPVRIGSHTLKFMNGDLTNEIFSADPGLRVVPCYN